MAARSRSQAVSTRARRSSFPSAASPQTDQADPLRLALSASRESRSAGGRSWQGLRLAAGDWRLILSDLQGPRSSHGVPGRRDLPRLALRYPETHEKELTTETLRHGEDAQRS